MEVSPCAMDEFSTSKHVPTLLFRFTVTSNVWGWWRMVRIGAIFQWPFTPRTMDVRCPSPHVRAGSATFPNRIPARMPLAGSPTILVPYVHFSVCFFAIFCVDGSKQVSNVTFAVEWHCHIRSDGPSSFGLKTHHPIAPSPSYINTSRFSFRTNDQGTQWAPPELSSEAKQQPRPRGEFQTPWRSLLRYDPKGGIGFGEPPLHPP